MYLLDYADTVCFLALIFIIDNDNRFFFISAPFIQALSGQNSKKYTKIIETNQRCIKQCIDRE